MSKAYTNIEDFETPNADRLRKETVPREWINPVPKTIKKTVIKWDKDHVSFRKELYLFSVNQCYEEYNCHSLKEFLDGNPINKSFQECYKTIARAETELIIFEGDFKRVGTIIDSHLDVMIGLCRSSSILHLEILRSIYYDVVGKNAYDKNIFKASDFTNAFEKRYCNQKIDVSCQKSNASSNKAPCSDEQSDISEYYDLDIDDNFEDDFEQPDEVCSTSPPFESESEGCSTIVIPDLAPLIGDAYDDEISSIKKKLVNTLSKNDITNIFKLLLEDSKVRRSDGASYIMFDYMTSGSKQFKDKKSELNRLTGTYIQTLKNKK